MRDKRGQPCGLRPSVCNDHAIGSTHVRRVPESPGRCRVREGIQWRTTIPGIPEMLLFHALEALHQEYPQQLRSVSLWPGIDRYDFRLEFGDGKVWAVDVKDHRKPDRLAKDLKPLYNEGSLHYDEAFYVFPMRRLQAYSNYIGVVLDNLTPLPTNHHLMGEADFQSRVAAKAKSLKRNGKKNGEKSE